MLEKTCLHSMTFLGRKPGSDICLHPAYIPSVAFSMPEKGGLGCRGEQGQHANASLTQLATFPPLPESSKGLRPS